MASHKGEFGMQRRTIARTACVGLAVMFFSSLALAQYQLTNVVSNQIGQRDISILCS